ncbi:hypothetical protein [Mycolicibacterium sp. 120270]|uniref:hypothetical protein n=1 Tax=Mycolicibacterium sp. 120270 TaxID=3090600 RepID=UPI00299D9A35|nr:hypothetical protein [Mycolicibacterium sp. 120270]MDX1887843.1 hypothetical protein [Mycolicibacterium sp. 120270]
MERRQLLEAFLDTCSEDELIEEVLLPLFRQLGFHRITAAGHKDKALEYGKDVWMRYTLPTQHLLYFGIQAKKDKLDASGVTKAGNANMAEIYNQALMMLAHEIFDPETNRRALVDHAFIVAGGEITKAARNWLGNALDATKRSQIIFMDRTDILNLYVVTSVPLPAGALPDERDPWAIDPNEPPFWTEAEPGPSCSVVVVELVELVARVEARGGQAARPGGVELGVADDERRGHVLVAAAAVVRTIDSDLDGLVRGAAGALDGGRERDRVVAQTCLSWSSARRMNR